MPTDRFHLRLAVEAADQAVLSGLSGRFYEDRRPRRGLEPEPQAAFYGLRLPGARQPLLPPRGYLVESGEPDPRRVGPGNRHRLLYGPLEVPEPLRMEEEVEELAPGMDLVEYSGPYALYRGAVLDPVPLEEHFVVGSRYGYLEERACPHGQRYRCLGAQCVVERFELPHVPLGAPRILERLVPQDYVVAGPDKRALRERGERARVIAQVRAPEAEDAHPRPGERAVAALDHVSLLFGGLHLHVGVEVAVGRELVALAAEALQETLMALKQARGHAEGHPYAHGAGALLEAAHHIGEPRPAEGVPHEDLRGALDGVQEALGLYDMAEVLERHAILRRSV